MGRGLLWADGEVHRRQRKVMLPGFGGEPKAMTVKHSDSQHYFSSRIQGVRVHIPTSECGGAFCLPFYRQLAFNDCQNVQMTNQWTDILVSSPGQSAVLNVATWLSRATMDSIGEGMKARLLLASTSLLINNLAAAFDYQFGALTNSKNEFMEAYMGLMYAMTS